MHEDLKKIKDHRRQENIHKGLKRTLLVIEDHHQKVILKLALFM
jgi:hypothetical protein